MPELGETTDPAALVPGDPGALFETAWSLRVYADVLDEAGAGLSRLGAPEGWRGVAADEFRARFHVEPSRWSDAAACHRAASAAVEAYAEVLQAAQRQAAEAVSRWRPAGAPPLPEPMEGPAAVALLAEARDRVLEAGDRAATTVAAARDRAPAGPGLLADLSSSAGTVAAQLGNAAASLGNAALRHPLDGLAVVGGGTLAAVSAAGVLGGVGLTATGAGAVAGVPLGAASAAGVATGVGLAGVGAIDLALNATGPDRVRPFQVNEDGISGDRAPRTALGERIASTGEPGRQPNVRQLPSDEAVRELYEEIGSGGEPLDRPSYPGRWITTPDGTEIGFRENSKSGGPTIDIRSPNGEAWKIHRR